jgi:hypothetical protein
VVSNKETIVKKFASVVAVLLIAVTEACGGQPSNLLIGTWKLDRSSTAPSPYCQEPLTFAEKSRTEPDVNGKMNTAPVTYVAGETKTFPTVVWMITDAGMANHTTYRFLSKDKMVLDTAWQCAYVRQ